MRCRLGWHRWREFGAGVVGYINARTCRRCGKTEYKSLGVWPDEYRRLYGQRSE